MNLISRRFEAFNVPAIYPAWSGLLPLYHYENKRTALILEIGSVTQIIPVYEGHVIFNAVKRVNMGGDEVTDALVHSLTQSNHRFQHSTTALHVLNNMKERCCRVALDYKEELKDTPLPRPVMQVDMDDGTNIKLNLDRYVGEILFQPSLYGFEFPGVHQLVYDSIMSCELDVRRELFGNIILSGGTTMMTGFKERLHKELTILVQPSIKVNIIADEERKNLTFLGAQKFVKFPEMSQVWLVKEEYDEVGVQLAHTRCSIPV